MITHGTPSSPVDCAHVQVQREIRIHGQLQHEHIIALYAAFEDAEHVYLALEYANGACMLPCDPVWS